MKTMQYFTHYEIEELINKGGHRWQNYELDRIYLRHHFVEGYIEQYSDFIQSGILLDMNKGYIDTKSGDIRLPNAYNFPELTESIIKDAVKDAMRVALRKELEDEIEAEEQQAQLEEIERQQEIWEEMSRQFSYTAHVPAPFALPC